MNFITFTAILKLLDIIHDYIMCPAFGDKKDKVDYEKILNKLTEIETMLLIMKDKENGK